MASRKSYSREFKLQVVNFYHNFNLSQTTKNFDLNSKTVLRWVKQEKELILSRNTSRKVKGSRNGLWPELEDKLAKEMEELRRKESRVKKGWVMSRAKELKEEMDPSHPLAFSDGWYNNFMRRIDPSKRRKTSKKRYPPENERESLQDWQSFTVRNALRGSKTRQRRGRPLVCTAEHSGCDVTKVKTEFDESQVELDPQETSQEQQGNWTRVEIKVEQDDQGKEGTSQGVSNDLRDSISVDQDQSSSSGSQSDIPDTHSDQWTAWIKEEIDTGDQTEDVHWQWDGSGESREKGDGPNSMSTCWQRGGVKGSWQGDDDDTPISTQNVQNIGGTQTVNTWLQRADVGNIDDENHPSFASEVFGSEGPNQKEHDDASFEPTRQKEGQEHNMKRESEDSEREVDTSETHHVCGSCSKAFKIKSNLEAHERTHRGEKPFACNICSEAFDEKGQFNTHVRQHDKYACMFCPETFTDKGELREHVMTHDGSRHHVCELCPEAFHRRHDLQAHMETHRGQRTFACDLCPKAFQLNRGLQTHMSKVHTGPKNHACKLCTEKFRIKKELEEHIKRWHTVAYGRPKNHACKLCNEKFGNKKELVKHVKLGHTVARPYTCNLCPKAFSKENYLELHMNVHTGVNICDVCSQSFSSEGELETHMKMAHPEHTPYACDVCFTEFKKKSNRDRHRRWKHPESLQI